MNKNTKNFQQKRNTNDHLLLVLVICACIAMTGFRIYGSGIAHERIPDLEHTDKSSSAELSANISNGAIAEVDITASEESTLSDTGDDITSYADGNEISDVVSDTTSKTDDTVSESSTDEAADADTDTDPEPLPREYTDVDDDYFDDALFIGDSRMVGLSQYCEAIDTRADFFVKKALTIYNLADDKPVKLPDGTTASLWEVLDKKQYGKIYLMVGINEIGTGTPEYFADAYADVLERIRDTQPDAIIFINSIMHVSRAKSDTDSLYNNINIDARNDAISPLANDYDIFYLNVNESLDDDTGALSSELTFDDIHLKGSCYEPWHEYLLSHGITISEINDFVY